MVAINEPVELGESWSGDRVLDDEIRGRLKSTLRSLLSITEPEDDLVEITKDLPLDVTQLNIEYYREYVLAFELFVDHPNGLNLVTDEVVDCPNHTDGNPLSTLAELGEDYEALEKDLLEVISLMADLPEFEEERVRYVSGDFAFINISCYEGTLSFVFMCPVGLHVQQAYQDGAFLLGRKAGIPVEPSTDEILGPD